MSIYERFVIASLLVILLSACSRGGSHRYPAAAKSDVPTWLPLELDDGWKVTTAKQAGLDACVLDSMTAVLRQGAEFPNVHAVLIARDSQLVYEEYFTGEDRRWRESGWERTNVEFHRDTLHTVRSVGKTLTSALVGIALESGEIPSLDIPLFDYFPEHSALLTPKKRQITLQHALTMSAGFEWNQMEVPFTNPANDEERLTDDPDPAAFVLGRAVVAEPGTVWYYNTGLPVLLGMVVSRATGKPFADYARDVLFEPLEIRHFEWSGPQAWHDIGELAWHGTQPWSRVAHPGGSLWLRPRDLAKIGSLYLNRGRWNGHQVLPTQWVEESTRWHIATKDSVSEYGKHGYGYYNWSNDRLKTAGGSLEVYTAMGNGDQRIFVVPTKGLVVVHLAGRYNVDSDWASERLLLQYIVPAALHESSKSSGSC